jgi:hypothetical protein
MPRKTKRGGDCSVFAGKTKKKDQNAILLKRIFKDMPPDVSEMLLVLLKKDPQFIKDKIKGLKLDEIEKQIKELDDKLMAEVNKLGTPEKKIAKFTELRRTEITKDGSIYNAQEQTILIEELDRVNKIFNSSANPPKGSMLGSLFGTKKNKKENVASNKKGKEALNNTAVLNPLLAVAKNAEPNKTANPEQSNVKTEENSNRESTTKPRSIEV